MKRYEYSKMLKFKRGQVWMVGEPESVSNAKVASRVGTICFTRPYVIISSDDVCAKENIIQGYPLTHSTTRPDGGIVFSEPAPSTEKSLILVNQLTPIESKNLLSYMYTLSSTLMDKIDRSMYERKCDIITWSRLRAIRELADNCTEEKQEEVNQLLHEYVEVFDVYEEIVVVDVNGKIIATGNNKDYIGKDYSNEDWFKRCMRQNDGHISDMFYSEKLKKYTMLFSCPIVTENGKKVGVISSKLNWEAVYDIIDRAKIGETGEVYVINKTGEVIASKNRMDILNRNLTDAYSAARDVISGKEYGYEIEDINGEITAIIGYAHTKGYKTFAGKEWSVVVREVF